MREPREVPADDEPELDARPAFPLHYDERSTRTSDESPSDDRKATRDASVLDVRHGLAEGDEVDEARQRQRGRPSARPLPNGMSGQPFDVVEVQSPELQGAVFGRRDDGPNERRPVRRA